MNELFHYLKAQFLYQLNVLFENPTGELPSYLPPAVPDFTSTFIANHELDSRDILLLGLALAPHIQPALVSTIVAEYLVNGGELPELGGVKLKNHRGTFPTGETAQFLLGGNNLEGRLEFYEYIHSQSVLFAKGIVQIQSMPLGEPKLSGMLILEEEYVEFLLTGRILKPQMSANFPAQLIETNLCWEDLILSSKTMKNIQEIQAWIDHNQVLFDQWELKGKVKPGYRVLLYGPPGTGKTLTASLLGKYTNRDVYRIDLSMVVSKYIGETEKNLSRLFDKAIGKNWILFFDEADAIFGKRTSVRDAHDKYANQEVSYLLQRIDSHPGLVILASNFKGNMDMAFTRRFQSIIEFENPNMFEREKLWLNNLPSMLLEGNDIDIKRLSRTYDLTGANIVNVVQFACLKTAASKDGKLLDRYLMEGIKKEYVKEGKML
jgi:AAA+ superfamily predicted ATPase